MREKTRIVLRFCLSYGVCLRDKWPFPLWCPHASDKEGIFPLPLLNRNDGTVYAVCTTRRSIRGQRGGGTGGNTPLDGQKSALPFHRIYLLLFPPVRRRRPKFCKIEEKRGKMRFFNKIRVQKFPPSPPPLSGETFSPPRGPKNHSTPNPQEKFPRCPSDSRPLAHVCI